MYGRHLENHTVVSLTYYLLMSFAYLIADTETVRVYRFHVDYEVALSAVMFTEKIWPSFQSV